MRISIISKLSLGNYGKSSILDNKKETDWILVCIFVVTETVLYIKHFSSRFVSIVTFEQKVEEKIGLKFFKFEF